MQYGNSGARMERATAKKICDEIAKPGVSVRRQPQVGDFFHFGHRPDMSKVEVVTKRRRVPRK